MKKRRLTAWHYASILVLLSLLAATVALVMLVNVGNYRPQVVEEPIGTATPLTYVEPKATLWPTITPLAVGLVIPPFESYRGIPGIIQENAAPVGVDLELWKSSMAERIALEQQLQKQGIWSDELPLVLWRQGIMNARAGCYHQAYGAFGLLVAWSPLFEPTSAPQFDPAIDYISDTEEMAALKSVGAWLKFLNDWIIANHPAETTCRGSW